MTLNLAIDISPHTPSPRELMERALEPHVLLGMPHLNPYGLSETWLMKELGHRHWVLLAIRLGMENADFRTPDGREVYASLCATSLQKARLELAAANDVLTIRSSVEQVSRTQWSSRHWLEIRGFCIGEVELVSAFVHRTVEGDNRTLARVGHWGALAEPFAKSELAATAASFRRGTAESHLGMSISFDSALLCHRFRPSPHQEFNGAGLFYFAEFQAIADRAVETWFPDETRSFTRRDAFFTGNIVPGEMVTTHLRYLQKSGSLRYACELTREDGTRIAYLFVEDTQATRRAIR
ncbi:putative biosynthetic protein (TIGR04099 family) [Rhizobium petrolearium]|uniref:Pnap_2097 family protein n=1 Tax=Neorhizobium petrolearium TaxID=515361 RepID=UPI001FDCA6B3|nr:Pnap_2097 family protein [Neorhizobium petrolearium]MBP1842999.1 putative biosynthetic protein (TIGR04099 family) [Neorhizobium petrolearium]